MKKHLILLTIVLTIIGCEKEKTTSLEPEINYDCCISNITYTENNEFQYQENYYYLNNLVIKVDCSPRYVWKYTYDSNNNPIRFDSMEGSYTLNSYDNSNRCIISKRYIKDTLYLITNKDYKDTLLTKEILIEPNGDTLNIIKYYYNEENTIDSIISYNSNIYHTYFSNKHIVTKLNNSNIKFYESISINENGLSIFEEYYYNDNLELYKSLNERKEYDENDNITKIVLEQFDLYANSTHYDEIVYIYDSIGKKIRSDSFNGNGNLLNYREYIYNQDNLIKIQSFDSNGNKAGYTTIENTCE